jgi:hypothetical protein
MNTAGCLCYQVAPIGYGVSDLWICPNCKQAYHRQYEEDAGMWIWVVSSTGLKGRTGRHTDQDGCQIHSTDRWQCERPTAGGMV